MKNEIITAVIQIALYTALILPVNFIFIRGSKGLDILQRHFTGYYSIKIKKKYLTFPKLAPLMTFSILVTFLGDVYENIGVRVIGFIYISISVFCFFMLRILKKRQFNGLTKRN